MWFAAPGPTEEGVLREGAPERVDRESGGKRDLDGRSLCAHFHSSALLLPCAASPFSAPLPLPLPSPLTPVVEGRVQSGRLVDMLLQLSFCRHTWV